MKRLLRWLRRHWRWYVLRACPDCGSQSENWRRDADACADCGRGIVFRNPVRGSLQSIAGSMMIESFMAGEMSEDDFAQAALAGGMRAATVLEFIDQRRAEFHDKGEEPPL